MSPALWDKLKKDKQLLTREERQVFAVLLAFGDESADAKKERVFAVAAVIGRDEQWAWLEDRWTIICDGTPFHAKDCESDRGDFSPVSARPESGTLPRSHHNAGRKRPRGFGIAIDLAAQRRVNPHALETFAYYKCLLEVVQKMRNCAAYNNEIVKFTFDTRHESEYNTGLLYGMAKDAKDWKPFIDAEIDFACSRTNPRIQAADLFTRETMKALDNHIGPVKRPMRKSWQCLNETNRFHMGAFGEEWFRDLMAHMSDLERKTNVSMSDYAQWLETKGTPTASQTALST